MCHIVHFGRHHELPKTYCTQNAKAKFCIFFAVIFADSK